METPTSKSGGPRDSPQAVLAISEGLQLERYAVLRLTADTADADSQAAAAARLALWVPPKSLLLARRGEGQCSQVFGCLGAGGMAEMMYLMFCLGGGIWGAGGHVRFDFISVFFRGGGGRGGLVENTCFERVGQATCAFRCIRCLSISCLLAFPFCWPLAPCKNLQISFLEFHVNLQR